jgi:subtilase family serine protease
VRTFETRQRSNPRKETGMAITVQTPATKAAKGMMLTWMSMKARRVAKAAAAACALLGAAGLTAFGAGTPVAHAAVLAGRQGPPTSAQCMKDLGVACYSPLQVERAYNLPPLYAKGLTGKGRTIVIVDPFGSPTIRHDLRVFDRAFGLSAPPAFRVLQPVGKVPPFNPKNPGMVAKAAETTLDVEWSHAIAPGANILLVETPVQESVTGGGFPQFMAAENYVITHHLGDVISQSFGLPEQNFAGQFSISRLRYAYRSARRHHVTVLAASNDLGVTGPTPADIFYRHRIVDWPASDPLVTGVGGTRLHLNKAGVRTSPDTAWNDTHNAAALRLLGETPPFPFASTGGVSEVFTRPGYQDPVRGRTGNHRGVPDVALSASLSGAVLIFASFNGTPVWFPGGGTSEAAPEFAGIVAIADQYAHQRLGLINPALYRLEQAHAPGIVDVTKGSNTVSVAYHGQIITLQGYRARPGYDLVTGIGTINAALFVPELARAG